jgi:hypothetical protein
MPGLITGVPVEVGTARSVDVAEGGNQTMVAVGVSVSAGLGVSVSCRGPMGRQAVAMKVIASRSEMTTTLPYFPGRSRFGPLAGRRDIKRKSLIT